MQTETCYIILQIHFNIVLKLFALLILSVYLNVQSNANLNSVDYIQIYVDQY